MDSLILNFIISILLNVLFIAFFVIFMKNSWFKLKSIFMKNPTLITIIQSSGKKIEYLVSPKEKSIEKDNKTYSLIEDRCVYDGKIAQYVFKHDNSEPLDLRKGNTSLDPGFLTNLLLQAQLSGSTDFIKKLLQFKYLVLSFIVIALGVAFCVYKLNDMTTTLNTIQTTLTNIKNTGLVG